MGGCILYTGIRLLLLIPPFISSFFFLSNFQTLPIFVTLFSGTERPRRLKLGTRMDSGQMYGVYWNQAAALICPIYFFIFFLSNFQTLKFFVTQSSTESGCWCLFVPLFLHFSFSPIFKHNKFSSNFSQNCEA